MVRGERHLWTPEEDEMLKQIVLANGPKDWRNIAQKAREIGLRRDEKSCLCRWNDHLRPGLIHSEFTPDEDCKLLEYVEKYGHMERKWSFIGKLMGGHRSGDAVKRRYNKLTKSCASSSTGGATCRTHENEDEDDLDTTYDALDDLEEGQLRDVGEHYSDYHHNIDPLVVPEFP